MKTMPLMALALAALLAGCGETKKAEAPRDVYQRYYEMTRAGRSFEQDVAFHSAARREEVLAALPRQAASAGKTADEFKDFYLSMTQHMAECGDLTLKSETIEGRTAELVYDVKDQCTDAGGTMMLVVGMVDEDGWKIQSDEMKISAN